MLARLKETGLYDRALVVVTADHGVSFTNGGPGPRHGRGPAGARGGAWVPTFVKAPGQHGRRRWTTATGSTSTCCRRWPTWPA